MVGSINMYVIFGEGRYMYVYRDCKRRDRECGTVPAICAASSFILKIRRSQLYKSIRGIQKVLNTSRSATIGPELIEVHIP